MLLAVLVWAYAHRVRSSRRIEELCRTDVAFRVICAGNCPDHSTIARFRGGFPGPVAGFFAQVLGLCARLGMGRVGVVALDGMKIAASASKSANRTRERLRQLAEEAVAAHAAADAAEDELFGEGRRGDEVPPQMWSPRSRAERIAAALADLDAEREAAERAEQGKAQEFRARQAAGQRTGCPPAAAAVVLAEEKLARVRAARAARLERLEERYAAGHRRRREAGVEDYYLVRQAAAQVEKARAREEQGRARAAAREAARKGPGPVRNVTDPDSRLMPVRGGGFIQGYNTQNVTSSDGLIIATALTQDTSDIAWFAPMTAAAAAAAALIAARRPGSPDAGPGSPGPGGQGGGGIGLVLADAGYCSDANLTCDGPDRLIAAGKRRDLEKAARGRDNADTGRGGEAIAAMRERLKTGDGITAYRQRGHIAETPHGNIKQNMGLRQLSVRGTARATAEWTFAAAVHNLFKAITGGHLTRQALTGQAG
jgi:hypothetical protein